MFEGNKRPIIDRLRSGNKSSIAYGRSNSIHVRGLPLNDDILSNKSFNEQESSY